MTKGKVLMAVGLLTTIVSVLVLRNVWLYIACPFIGFGIGYLGGILDR